MIAGNRVNYSGAVLPSALVDTPATVPDRAVGQLCPACGLCCNGVLFSDVELPPGGEARKLEALGVTLIRKGRKLAFSQPCSCFDGQFCRIYEDRPARCRTFECRLLQRAQAGELTAASALKTIAQTRRQADKLLKLVRQLGQTDEHLPLNRRCSQLMKAPMDLAGAPEQIELRGELMLEVQKLMNLLRRDFLTG
jgi:uncharacterized protein